MGKMNPDKLFFNAQKLFIEGKKPESIKAFSDAIEGGFRAEIVFLSRGVAYFQTEQIDKAIEDFSMVIGMNDGNMRAHFYRGIAYMTKNDFLNAVIDFNRTIELKPDHGAAFFARGAAYIQLGNDEEAARNIKTALIYSEATAQGFADTMGMVRTQFDKAIAIKEGIRSASTMELTDEEIERLRKWLEE